MSWGQQKKCCMVLQMGTIIMEGGYKVLNHDEVLEILKNSL